MTRPDPVDVTVSRVIDAPAELLYDLVADDFRPSFRGAGAAATARTIDRSVRGMASIVTRASRKAAAPARVISV